ncbi:MAG: hypothetical protein ACI9QC_000586 [Oceanicoccus sp.]|jgi:hypothetical protein
MPFIRLCQTREVLPQEVEHYFNAKQNQAQTWTWLQKDQTQLHSSLDPGELFTGARTIEGALPELTLPYSLKHRRGPLFPIKRYRQFEDTANRFRIYPTDKLIHELKKADALQVRVTPLSSRKQDRVRKKAQSLHFHPESAWDRFESQKWFTWGFRNLIGGLWRKARGSMELRQSDPKQSLRHDREAPREAILDKLSRPLFQVEILATRPIKAFSQSFNLPYLGELRWSRTKNLLTLSSEELATLLSPPSLKTIAESIESEACAWIPGNLEIPQNDRLKHLHILGKTGMGKSTAILNLFQQDLCTFPQIMVMDPHGDLIEKIKKLIPRGKKVILLDPSNREFPLALNPLQYKKGDSLEQKASSLLEMFFALSKGSWGPRLEYILRNTILTLLLCPNTTLLDIPRILTHPKTTREFSKKCGDMELQRFWEEEFLAIQSRLRQEMISPILNKVGPLLSTPLLRNIFGQSKAKFSFDQVLEEPCIILVPLAKSQLGEDASRLLGMSIISMLHGSLLRRKTPHPLSFTIDEFQNIATPTLMTMLSESRKFGLALSLAHQYIKQVPEPIMDAILGNVGSHLVLRTSHEDAEQLAPLLQLETEDLINIPELNAYIKTLKAGQPQTTKRVELKFPAPLSHSFTQAMQVGRPRALVEAKLKARYNQYKSTPRK